MADSDATSDSNSSDASCLIEKIYLQIDDRIERRDSPGEKFITLDSLNELWKDQLSEFVGVVKPGFGLEQIPFVRDNLLKTVCILVYLSWNDWPRFGEIFQMGKGVSNRVDDRITEYTLAELEDPSFLWKPWGQRFHEQRFTFSPIELIEEETVSKSKEWRLPFRATERMKLGAGSSGEVIKEHIAPGQLWRRSVQDGTMVRSVS
jgi:hypothetical protein